MTRQYSRPHAQSKPTHQLLLPMYPSSLPCPAASRKPLASVSVIAPVLTSAPDMVAAFYAMSLSFGLVVYVIYRAAIDLEAENASRSSIWVTSRIKASFLRSKVLRRVNYAHDYVLQNDCAYLCSARLVLSTSSSDSSTGPSLRMLSPNFFLAFSQLIFCLCFLTNFLRGKSKNRIAVVSQDCSVGSSTDSIVPAGYAIRYRMNGGVRVDARCGLLAGAIGRRERYLDAGSLLESIERCPDMLAEVRVKDESAGLDGYARMRRVDGVCRGRRR